MVGEVRSLALPNGTRVPVLGQGTWYLGDSPEGRDAEIRALRTGLDLGLTLIDTAEMYGDGRAEELVGEAIAGRRDGVFLVSKVLPWNATARGTARAVEASLRRLRTDRLDLCLYHWRGSTPLAESVAALQRLQEAGKILAWGVSNLDVDDMDELAALPGAVGAAGAQVDQILYNLTRRGVERGLMARLEALGIPIMAYSPIEQARLLGHPVLGGIARKHGVDEAAVALAWVLRLPDVIAIPKAGTAEHVRANRAALDLTLDADDLAALDSAFPAPARPGPLEML